MNNILAIGINSKYTHSSLSLRYFREYSKADIFECSINDNIFEVFSKLSEFNHKFFCFSCYIWNIEFVLKLISMIKSASPEKQIILGGPEAGYNYENLINNQNIDGIIRGEGEEALLLLNQNLGFSDIPNLVYKENNETKINELKKFDLEKAKFPYNEKDLKDLENKIIYFESSRGCLYNCAYCLSSSEGKTRYFPMEYVKNGLDFFINNKVKLIKFVDRTFNDNPERCTEIAKYILENNKETRFHFEISPMLITDEFLSVCQKMGDLVQFELGIQTTNPDTMKAIHRSFDKEKVKISIEKIPKNIHVHLDLITGLPYETVETLKDGFNYVYSMKPHMLQLGFLKLLHNTELKKDSKNYGILTTEFPPYEVIATNTISASEMIKIKNAEKAVDRIYNSGNFKNTLKELEQKDMFSLFMLIGEKLYEKEKQGPVSNVGLYEFLYEIFGNKIKLALAVDFMENNKKSKLPDFLDEEIPDLKERHKKLHKDPLYKDKKVRIVKTCDKYFIITDDEVTLA